MSSPNVVLHSTARQSFVTDAQVQPAGVTAYPPITTHSHAGVVAVDIAHMSASPIPGRSPESQRSSRSGKRTKNNSSRGSGASARDASGKKKDGKHSISRTSPSDSFSGRYAVDVRGVTHSYDGKKDVLTKLDLQIEPGKIYGLLGPSGCGKSTLIKCLLAQLRPKEGDIAVFGEVPGSALSRVPGCDVGYMPQEIALYDEFTVTQNLHFYAKVQNMSEKDFQRRSKYLCKLLDLKDPHSKNAGQLSGGQQRRASLACGLLHCPKLLILDEPTVGVDPTLRTKIWRYLTKISREEGTTVLLTTHYIEEARRAHRVGLMRDGKMLQQGTPKEIMQKTQCKTLEAAFLQICKKDEKKEENDKQDEEKDRKSSKGSGCWPCRRTHSSSSAAANDSDDSSEYDTADDDDIDDDASVDDAAAAEAEADVINEGGGDNDGGNSGGKVNQRRSSPSASPAFGSDDDSSVSSGGGASKKKSSATFAGMRDDDYKQPLLSSPGGSSPMGGGSNKRSKALQSPTASGYDVEQGGGSSSSGGGNKQQQREDGKGSQEMTRWESVSTALALPRWPQLWGLCWKNIMRMVKGVGAMIFQFILPSIQVILFCVAIGQDPRHIHFGAVNLDTFAGPIPIPNITNTIGHSAADAGAGAASSLVAMMPHGLGGDGAGLFLPDWNAAAHGLIQKQGRVALFDETDDDASVPSNFLAQDFLADMNEHFIMHDYASESEARAAVETNSVWGFVYIPTNFTLNTLERAAMTLISPAIPLSNDTILNSTLRYTLDLSNEQMSIFLVKSIADAYQKLIGKYAPSLEETSPLQMDPPVYGSADASFTDFVAPGIIITIAFSGSIGLTAITFVLDKKTGNLDRIWASGVRASEIMLAQVLTQLIIFIIQIGLLLIFGLLVFKLPLEGSVVLLFVICILLGITGMMFGLVIASKVTEERDAMQCALGSFFPALLLSGVMWPVESIPVPLYQIALGLPTTWAAEAGRSIMSRGWGLEHRQVWLGLVVPTAWSFVFFLWAARSLRPKQ